MSFYKEVPGRQTTLESTLKFDLEPTEGSTNPVTSDGVASGISQSMRDFEEVMYADQEIPASTLRFSFGDLNYDPTQDTTVASKHNTAERAGGGTPAGYGGTWKKLRTKYTNIWDYTYVDNTLLNEFDNGNYVYEATPATRFWNDVEHNPIKIIASNTTGCESFKRAFQGCWAITEIWELDMSDALNVSLAFSYCKNLMKIQDTLDISSSTNNVALFQDCWIIKHIGQIVLNTNVGETYSAQYLFHDCRSLERIDGQLDFANCTNMYGVFCRCINLEYVDIINTSGVENWNRAFGCCCKIPIEIFDAIDASGATILEGLFNGLSKRTKLPEVRVIMTNVNRIPEMQLPNANAVSFEHMFEYCDLREIDSTKFASLGTSIKVLSMFNQNHNCNSGIKDTYDVLSTKSPSTYETCFYNCGINTPTGRAELEQIPASWGGLAEG